MSSYKATIRIPFQLSPKYRKFNATAYLSTGQKGYEGSETDFRLFQSLAHEDTLLFIDDTAPEEVVNFAIPSKNLREDADEVARRWLEKGKIEVLEVLALPWAQKNSWISDGVTNASQIYPRRIGHGTLVARYTRKLQRDD